MGLSSGHLLRGHLPPGGCTLSPALDHCPPGPPAHHDGLLTWPGCWVFTQQSLGRRKAVEEWGAWVWPVLTVCGPVTWEQGLARPHATFIWSRQHPWEGGFSETAGALARIAQLVSGKSGLAHGPCACPSWSLGPFSCVPAALLAATAPSAPWACSALGRRQSRGGAASGFRASRLPPLPLRPLPGPEHPKLGLRALSVILSINTFIEPLFGIHLAR